MAARAAAALHVPVAPPTPAPRYRAPLVLLALLVPLGVAAALTPFRDRLTPTVVVLALVLVVVAAAATADRAVGITAAVSSGAWFDFFWTEPRLRLTIAGGQDAAVTVLLVLIGVAVTEVALWGRRQQARASRSAGYLEGALRTAEAASSRLEPADAVVHRIARQVGQLLGVEASRFVHGPVDTTGTAVLDHDGAVTLDGERIRVDVEGLPSDTETALPVLHRGRVVGAFLLTSAAHVARPTLEQRRVAALLADEAGSALAEDVHGAPGPPPGPGR